MKKKFLSLFLTVVLLVNACMPAWAVFEEVDLLPTIEYAYEEEPLQLMAYADSSNFSKNYTLTSNQGENIARVAYAQIGRNGSELGYNREWCAAFVSDCARIAGISTSVLADTVGASPGGFKLTDSQLVDKADAKKGDIVFWRCSKCTSDNFKSCTYCGGAPFYHVGIYYENGKIISGNNAGSSLYARTVKSYTDSQSGLSNVKALYYRPNYKDSLSDIAKKSVGKTKVELGIEDDAWCCYFVGYCINNSFVADLAESTIPSNYAANAIGLSTWLCSKNIGTYYSLSSTHTERMKVYQTMVSKIVESSISSFVPLTGDIIIFDWNGREDPNTVFSHAGIVTSYDGTNITYVDGNSIGAGSTTVLSHTKKKSESSIIAYVRINKTENEYISVSDGEYYINNDGYRLNMLVDAQQKNSINASNGSINNSMKFTVTQDGNYHKIVPTNTQKGLVLNAFWANNSYTAHGDEVTLYSNTSDPSQRWYFEECNGGYLIHPGDATQLSMTRDTSTNKIYLNNTTKAANQIWTLEQYNYEKTGTVNFYAGDGILTSYSKDVSYGLPYGTLPIPTLPYSWTTYVNVSGNTVVQCFRDDYRFHHWYTYELDKSTGKYNEVTITEDSIVNFNGDKTLFAEYTYDTTLFMGYEVYSQVMSPGDSEEIRFTAALDFEMEVSSSDSTVAEISLVTAKPYKAKIVAKNAGTTQITFKFDFGTGKVYTERYYLEVVDEYEPIVYRYDTQEKINSYVSPGFGEYTTPEPDISKLKPNSLYSLATVDGIKALKIVANHGDPSVFLKGMRVPLDKYKYFACRIKPMNGKDNNTVFFHLTDNRSINFENPIWQSVGNWSSDQSGEWITMSAPLGTMAEGSKTYTGCRFDYFNIHKNVEIGDYVYLDYIAFFTDVKQMNDFLGIEEPEIEANGEPVVYRFDTQEKADKYISSVFSRADYSIVNLDGTNVLEMTATKDDPNVMLHNFEVPLSEYRYVIFKVKPMEGCKGDSVLFHCPDNGDPSGDYWQNIGSWKADASGEWMTWVQKLTSLPENAQIYTGGRFDFYNNFDVNIGDTMYLEYVAFCTDAEQVSEFLADGSANDGEPLIYTFDSQEKIYRYTKKDQNSSRELAEIDGKKVLKITSLAGDSGVVMDGFGALLSQYKYVAAKIKPMAQRSDGLMLYNLFDYSNVVNSSTPHQTIGSWDADEAGEWKILLKEITGAPEDASVYSGCRFDVYASNAANPGDVTYLEYIAFFTDMEQVKEYMSSEICVITYNENEGIGGPIEQVELVDNDIIITSSVPTRDGYEFKGWATSKNGIAVYQPGDVYTAKQSVTLYAVWEKKIVYGDVMGDGDVGVSDVIFTLKLIASGGALSVSENQKTAADVNGDGKIDVSDAIRILKHIANPDISLNPNN